MNSNFWAFMSGAYFVLDILYLFIIIKELKKQNGK